ncbi:PHA/PHB synthase family protein [Geodermatophilus obscurus]|uniref:Poly-beta-hydroxybutyrate polymerase domain protein n=1 Tax=Geodermatophilus obscurus (strain ATCC 25078 / DSM 43160 / JCM 3152 / CCUG 61914 / KCC A-0152 / KCTC 9177 / NBRC 13315 / NRRL B-3577 / G-20) TaxID=526225 RepID=D2S465_GEOOG|nr:alpha/beta fold hydrolase [Geodermatophilus obscurus]ADB75055.1 Poly-beta-hydroxybutyrate polymerase domain protein [Geodermatophilus obscurus DSM 43160]
MASVDDSREVAGAAAPLDLLLTQAAQGTVRRLSPGKPGLKFLGGLARRPDRVAARARSLAGQLAQIAAGTSDVAPSKRDKRFADPAWTENPVLRRLVQAYLATGETALGLLHDVPLEWRDAERVRSAGSNLVDALSPSNNPLISPVAWKAFIDSAGANVVKGPRNLVRDLASTPRIPTMVDPDAYEVGRDLAVTPGAVVLRTPVFELIQYRPTTPTVRTVPVLFVPPTINKYYVLDLAPGRSMVEHLVDQGQQVFMMSWRNPDARHRDWGLDTYGTAITDALDAVEEISGADTTHLLGTCSGGILASMTAAVLAATGRQDRLASLSLLVTVLDHTRAGLTGLMDADAAAQAVEASRRAGYLDGRKLAEVFAWLRPNDLIWNYWVNNYLQGKQPPKFDILSWNSDTTRMTAQLHADFVDVALHNKLTHPGSVTMLGTEVDLSQITLDSYVLAGSADHICPWDACYRSSQLLGGKVRFVQSTNGHIAALVNPPGNPKSSYRVTDGNSVPAAQWTETARTEKGSWWPDHAAWLGERSGPDKPAPDELGSARFRVREDAPGSYVRDK